MSFTPFAKYFDFYSLQHQQELFLEWLFVPFFCFAVYKLLKVMTR